MLLEIDHYNSNEKEASRLLSNRINQAFSPALFEHIGYPTRVENEFELFKYVDVMQENRFDNYLDSFLGGFSASEYEQFKHLVNEVLYLSKSKLKRAGTGHNTIAHSFNVLRHIKSLTNNQPSRVLELGPGCGYLGALLGAENYPYMAMDVTQAFYLYQNRLWNQLFPGRLVEMASNSGSSGSIDSLLADKENSKLVHIPWWEWARLFKGKVPTFDVITCNHVLCEMHHDSLGYALKMARMMFEKSSGPRLLIFEGWGWNATNRLSWVASTLYKHGFALVHHDERIAVAGLRSANNNGEFLPQEQLVKSSDLTWGNGKLYIADALNEWTGPGRISSQITEARQSWAAQVTVNPDTVRSFLAETASPQELCSDDEEFWKFAEHPLE